jgi:uncharacterized LabA/DUF88 family protein
MSRVSLYIDGFNLYHAIDSLNQPRLKWLNLCDLGRSFLAPGDNVADIIFYTAVLTWNREKQARHRNYITALKAIGCVVSESRFAKVKKHCRAFDRYCDRHEEKQTDVAIATDILVHGLEDRYDTCILATADSDQVPTVKSFRKLFPHKRIILAAPPGHETQSRELGDLVHERRPLTVGRLRGCLLPVQVKNAQGKVVVQMPHLYGEA